MGTLKFRYLIWKKIWWNHIWFGNKMDIEWFEIENLILLSTWFGSGRNYINWICKSMKLIWNPLIWRYSIWKAILYNRSLYKYDLIYYWFGKYSIWEKGNPIYNGLYISMIFESDLKRYYMIYIFEVKIWKVPSAWYPLCGHIVDSFYRYYSFWFLVFRM